MSTRHAAHALPVIETAPVRRGPDRAADRRVTLAGLGIATMFLALAAASLMLPAEERLGVWLPAHFALAGAAGTAIASMLPFFVAALAVGRPAAPMLRIGAILLVASGTVVAVAGRIAAGGGTSAVAAVAAAAYILGMGLVAMSAALPLRGATGSRRPVTEAAYAIGLADVMVGVAIAATLLAGDPGATSRWDVLRAAHAWLNVFGFATLVIAGTLLHFAPTVAGSRIRARRSGAVAAGLLALGAPIVASGYGAGSGLLVWLGALAAVAGAAALSYHGVRAHRDRAGWTLDLPWHHFSGGSLLIAPFWLLVATLVAGAGIMAHGTDPIGWRFDLLSGPLVLGFVVQVVLGSLTHLLPAIGRGTPEAHAAQRRLLGRAAMWRLAGWNAGVAAVSAGQLLALNSLVAAGAAAALLSGVATLVLLVVALRR